MAKLPPLRNLRKTTIVVIAVFLAFLIHRLVVFYTEEKVVLDVDSTELTIAKSVVCSHIVNGAAFGVDSVFEAGTRLYFYSDVSTSLLSKDDSLMHIWFNGGDTIQKSPCSLSQNVCLTTIVPSLLTPGEWSVDLIAGRKLLSTRQFIVQPDKR